MYNPTKFNYATITRETVGESRQYATPDGERLPSVTTILEATKSQEKKRALWEWKKRVGEKRAQEISTEASSRGTRMHKFLETWVKTGTTGDPGSNPYSIQSHNMAQSIIDKGLSNCNEFWGTEVGLYYPKIYAGTTDLVGIHDGAEAIMDFKQTNKPKQREWIEDYFLQLLFYGTAHNVVYGTQIRKGVILMCSANNEFQEFIIEGNEWDKYESQMWIRIEQYYRSFL